MRGLTFFFFDFFCCRPAGQEIAAILAGDDPPSNADINAQPLVQPLASLADAPRFPSVSAGSDVAPPSGAQESSASGSVGVAAVPEARASPVASSFPSWAIAVLTVGCVGLAFGVSLVIFGMLAKVSKLSEDGYAGEPVARKPVVIIGLVLIALAAVAVGTSLGIGLQQQSPVVIRNSLTRGARVELDKN